MAERPFLGAGDVTSVSRKGHRSKRTWFEDLAKLQKRQDEEEQGDIRSLPGFRPEKMPGFFEVEDTMHRQELGGLDRTSRPSTADLYALEASGDLFNPATGQPKFPLTPEYIQGKGRAGAADYLHSWSRTLGGLVATGAGELGLDDSVIKSGDVAKRAAELRKEGHSVLEASRMAWEETEMPTMNVPISVGPYGSAEVPIGVKGGVELITDPLNLLFGAGAGVKVGKHVLTKGVKLSNGVFRPSAWIGDVHAMADDVAPVYAPPVNNPFGIPTMKTGLTRQEKIWNTLADYAPIVKKDELGVNVMKAREEMATVADNLATSMANEFDVKYKSAFKLDENGGIIGLGNKVDGIPGNPLIQDVAARLPLYKPHLTGEQLNFLKGLQLRIAPVRQQMVELGIPVKTRSDIMDGGFYLPRGNALEEGSESVKVTKRFPGKKSFEKPAVFDSAAQGIDENYKYAPFKVAIHSYIKQAGKKSANQWTKNVLKNAKDENGNPLGITPKMTLEKNPVYKKAQRMVVRMQDKRRQIIAQNTRANERAKVAEKAMRKADKAAADETVAAQRAGERATTSAGPAMQRTENARKRFLNNSGTYTGEDVKSARAMLMESISEGRTLVTNITRNVAELKVAKAKVRASDRLLEKLGREFTETLDEAQTMVDEAYEDMLLEMPTPKTGKTYEKLTNQLDRLQAKWDNLAAKQMDLEDRVTEIQDAGEELVAMEKINQSNTRGAVNLVKEIADVERVKTRLKTELTMLEREEARMIRLAEKTEKRELNRIKKDVDAAAGEAVNLDDRAAQALIELEKKKDALADLRKAHDDISGELDHIKKQANKPPSGYALITPEFQMGQMAFPAELVHAVDDVVRSELPTVGAKAWVPNLVTGYNRIYASMAATLDDSAVAIHGLLGLYNDPATTAQVFSKHWKAWGVHGEKLLGSFIDDFNRKAINSGRLTSEDWARAGTRIGGEDTEFMIGGQKGVSLLKVTPGIKQANRAFGYYGDMLRLKWADSELEDLMRSTGKTVQELTDSGDLAKIAEGVNSATGYSGRQFGGSLGDIALFAPRFLQARFENLVRASRAMVTDPAGAIEATPFVGRQLRNITPGTRDIAMTDRIARRSMLRMIGTAAFLTYGINEAQGRETDMRMTFIDDEGNVRYNSNFMRARLGERDVSLLGTYDSLMRLIVLSGTGHPIDAFRGLAAGLPSQAWDVLSGEDAMGQPDRAEWMPGDNEALASVGHVLEGFTPFAADELPHAIGKVREGDIGEAARTMGMEFFGVKNAPLGYYDLIDDIATEKRGGPLSRDRDIPLIPETWEELPGKGISKIGEGLKTLGVERGLEELGIRSTDEEIAGRKQKSPTAVGDEVGWDPENLSKGERRAIMNDPRMIEYLDSFDASQAGGLSQAFDVLEGHYASLETNLIAAIEGGGQNPRFGSLITGLKKNRSAAWNMFEDLNKEELGEEDLEEMHIADQFGLKYWSREIEQDPASGYVDWEKYEQEGKDILKAAADVHPDYVEYILSPSGPNENNYRSKRFNDQRVKDLVEERETDSVVLKEYHQIPMKIARILDMERLFDDYLKNPAKTQFLDMKDYDQNTAKTEKMKKEIIKAKDTAWLLGQIGQQKKAFRQQPENWHTDAILWKWGDGEPVNGLTLQFEEELKNRQIAEGSGLPMVDLRHIQGMIESQLKFMEQSEIGYR